MHVEFLPRAADSFKDDEFTALLHMIYDLIGVILLAAASKIILSRKGLCA